MMVLVVNSAIDTLTDTEIEQPMAACFDKADEGLWSYTQDT